jgi:hypothetical protein
VSRVYFIQAGPVRGDGLIKIGHAKNIWRRIQNMQVGCPVDLNLIASAELGEYAARVETRIHRAFHALRRPHSEWFLPHPVIYATAYRLERFRFDPFRWEEVEALEFEHPTWVAPSIDDISPAEEHW